MIRAQRRRWLSLAAATAVTSLSIGAAASEPRVWIITTSPPGSLMDIFARRLAVLMSSETGWAFGVDNAPGGGGVVAARRLLAPGGRTAMMLSDSTLLTNPALVPNLPYDTLTEIRGVAPLFVGPGILAVRSDMRINDWNSFASRSAAEPGRLTYGSVGPRSGPHLGMALLSSLSGLRWTHVPFKGGAEIAVELTAGRLDCAMLSRNTIAPLIATGAVRPIAVTEATEWPEVRNSVVLPTLFGNYRYRSIFGFVAPARLENSLVETLNRATQSAVSALSLEGKPAEWGVKPLASMPSERFNNLIANEIAQWKTWAKLLVLD